jgi:hypothetical protein
LRPRHVETGVDEGPDGQVGRDVGVQIASIVDLKGNTLKTLDNGLSGSFVLSAAVHVR